MTFKPVDFAAFWQSPKTQYKLMTVYLGYPIISHQFCANPTGGPGWSSWKVGIQPSNLRGFASATEDSWSAYNKWRGSSSAHERETVPVLKSYVRQVNNQNPTFIQNFPVSLYATVAVGEFLITATLYSAFITHVKSFHIHTVFCHSG